VAAVVLAGLSAGAARAGSPANPASNRQLSSSTVAACDSDASSTSCTTLALADVNTARAGEGVRPMDLPANFASLTVLEQLLVISDLERTARGLTPILGHSASLDADAERGAVAGQDPSPTSFNGDAWGSNWEGGYGSPLEADFVWLYDDGPGSNNVDCTHAGAAGCWGHRENVLASYHAPLVMGVGYTPTGLFGPSMTQLFVGGDTETAPGRPDAPLTPADYSPGSGTHRGSSHGGKQAALRIGRARFARGRLSFTATLVRGKGTVTATATRARRTIRLRVTRRGSQFAITGKLPRGAWTVRVTLVPARGWRGRTYAFVVRH
jgi:hypothetical protein